MVNKKKFMKKEEAEKALKGSDESPKKKRSSAEIRDAMYGKKKEAK